MRIAEDEEPQQEGQEDVCLTVLSLGLEMDNPKMDTSPGVCFIPHLDHLQHQGWKVGFFATFLVLIIQDPDAHGSSQEWSLHQENCDYIYDSKNTGAS